MHPALRKIFEDPSISEAEAKLLATVNFGKSIAECKELWLQDLAMDFLLRPETKIVSCETEQSASMPGFMKMKFIVRAHFSSGILDHLAQTGQLVSATENCDPNVLQLEFIFPCSEFAMIQKIRDKAILSPAFLARVKKKMGK